MQLNRVSEVGDDWECGCSECRNTMVVNACTKAAIIDEGAMTSAKSPSLRFDESVVTKPIPVIHWMSRLGQRQRGHSDSRR